jgi:hypothetical protein
MVALKVDKQIRDQFKNIEKDIVEFLFPPKSKPLISEQAFVTLVQ